MQTDETSTSKKNFFGPPWKIIYILRRGSQPILGLCNLFYRTKKKLVKTETTPSIDDRPCDFVLRKKIL